MLERPVAGEIKDVLTRYGKQAFLQTYRLPNGKEDDFFLFRGLVVPVIFLPITEDDHVIAVRQFRMGCDDFVLELPGGCPKSGQNWEETLCVELREETGYAGRKVTRLADGFWFDPVSVRTRYIPALIEGCTKVGDLELDATEMLEVVKFPLFEWVRKMMRGEIQDSKSIAVTFAALSRLGCSLRRYR